MDECARGTLRSSARPVEYSPWSRREPPSENLLHGASEGGCFGGLRRRNEGYHGRKPVEASYFIYRPQGKILLALTPFWLLSYEFWG